MISICLKIAPTCNFKSFGKCSSGVHQNDFWSELLSWLGESNNVNGSNPSASVDSHFFNLIPVNFGLDKNRCEKQNIENQGWNIPASNAFQLFRTSRGYAHVLGVGCLCLAVIFSAATIAGLLFGLSLLSEETLRGIVVLAGSAASLFLCMRAINCALMLFER